MQIQNASKKLHKVAIEQLLEDDSSIAKMRFIDDVELNRGITGLEVSPDNREAIPVIPIWGLYETMLTKKV